MDVDRPQPQYLGGNLRQRRDRFDYVLVETTGLADPGPVAQTFFVGDEIFFGKDRLREVEEEIGNH